MRSLNVLLLAAVLIAAQGCAGIGSRAAGGTADRRSAGTQVEDETIETKTMTRIQEKYKDSVQVTVTSYNRFVLITGDAPSEDTKANIERIIYSVPNVKKIANEISIGGLSSPSVRRTDTGICRDLKSDLNRNKSVQTGAIKVTADKGVVYLLGLVTHAEAKISSEIASTTPGVQKVVRVFEYID